MLYLLLLLLFDIIFFQDHVYVETCIWRNVYETFRPCLVLAFYTSINLFICCAPFISEASFLSVYFTWSP